MCSCMLHVLCYNSGMHRLLSTVALAACIASIVLASAALVESSVEAQAEHPAAELLELVNGVRLGEGLDPYRHSRLLSDAAQRHADDLAANGFADPNDVHLGSDGTKEEARIEEAGYAAWTQNGRLAVGENVWAGQGVPENVLASLLEDPLGRDNLLSDTYREIGIGYAKDGDGRSYYVLDFGARPNVLPIFINDGGSSTENPEVAVRLTNERVHPEGRGTAFMGEAIEIRISNEPAFEGLAWQPWAPLVPWVVPDSVGQHTVYVEFRDAAGRTTAAAESIFLDHGTPTTRTAPESTPTPEPPVSPSLEPMATEDVSAGDPELTPEDTTLTQAAPLDSSAQPAAATPFPTWTPLPSPVPTGAEQGQSTGAALSSPDEAGYDRPLLIVGILQGAALLLGVYLMIRHGAPTSCD